MAAKKKKKGVATAKPRKKRRRNRRVYRHVRIFMSPDARKWRRWCHDLDTILHELVKNPSIHRLTPKKIIARAEAFADEYHAMQERRRPEGLDPDFYD